MRVKGRTIAQYVDLPISEALAVFQGLPLTERETLIAGRVLKEIQERLQFLHDVGVGYLTLGRSAVTLSGGEGQRIRLATQIGANLTGVLYVLDEPSIGLHQRDNRRLLATLMRLRDLGNTIIVVEHDEETIRTADYLIDLGPGAGEHGGQVIFQGTPTELLADGVGSLTGRYLRGEARIDMPRGRRLPVPLMAAAGFSFSHRCSTHQARNAFVWFSELRWLSTEMVLPVGLPLFVVVSRVRRSS